MDDFGQIICSATEMIKDAVNYIKLKLRNNVTRFVPVTSRTTFPYGYSRTHAISFHSANQYVGNQLRSLLLSLPMSEEKPQAEYQ